MYEEHHELSFVTQLLKPGGLRRLCLLNSGWSLRISGFAVNSLESLKELSSDYQGVSNNSRVFAVTVINLV